MNRTVALILLLLLALPACAQTNVELKGTLANGAGKRIELRAYTDLLTETETLLDSADVAPDGSFSLRCYANYPRLVFLQIERYSQSFYVEPGRTYNIFMPDFDWNIDEKQNVYLSPVALPLQFLDLPDNELNIQIMRFDATIDSFLSQHREHLDRRFRPERRYFDSLETLLDTRRGDTSASFLNRYKEYRLAEMRLAMGFSSRSKLIQKYITDQPIRYHDDEYMRLFFALYDHSISRGNKRIPLWRLLDWMHRNDLHTFLDSLGLDPLLRNEQIRELAAIQALKEAYYDKDYDRNDVSRMVDRIAQSSKFPDHRRLASSLRQSFRSSEQGSQVPDFTLPDVNRKTLSLQSLKGKWVYLSFIRTGDPNCLRELETMASLRDSVYSKHPDVAFVTIVCDREFQKMYHLLHNSRRGHRYNWTWLHFDGQYRLLERFSVHSFPTFILLDPEGRRVYNYTPPPASGILLRGPWQKKNSDSRNFAKPHFAQ